MPPSCNQSDRIVNEWEQLQQYLRTRQRVTPQPSAHKPTHKPVRGYTRLHTSCVPRSWEHNIEHTVDSVEHGAWIAFSLPGHPRTHLVPLTLVVIVP